LQSTSPSVDSSTALVEVEPPSRPTNAAHGLAHLEARRRERLRPVLLLEACELLGELLSAPPPALAFSSSRPTLM
jgi:hypothetical protein